MTVPERRKKRSNRNQIDLLDNNLESDVENRNYKEIDSSSEDDNDVSEVDSSSVAKVEFMGKRKRVCI
jgi:hypothetical protein